MNPSLTLRGAGDAKLNTDKHLNIFLFQNNNIYGENTKKKDCVDVDV